jgi:hypothetical protein
MLRVHLFRTLVPALLLTAVAAQAPCPPQGLNLLASGGRLGDRWTIDLGGPASTFGLLGFDLQQGPTPTPIGTVCLGVTPLLSLLSFTTGPLGDAHFQGIMPANAALTGLRVYTAAAAVDPSRPSGFATSNGGVITAFPPRLFFLDPGTLTPFGSTPGGIDALDMVSGNVVFSSRLTTQVRDAVYVRELQWLVLLLGNGTLAGFDGFSGAQVFNATLSGPAASASKLAAVPGGNRLLLLTYGTAPSPFSAGTPGSLHIVALPSGALASSIPLSAGNPDDMVLVPGTNFVFLRIANGVVPVDHANSVLYSGIPLPTGFGGLIDWQLAGNRLWCLQSGVAASPFSTGQPAALSAIDVNNMALSFTNQLSMAAPVDFLRAGPGTTGPSLYVYGSLAAVLQEFDQANGAAWGSLPIGTGIADMRLSSLGTQWLILCTGAGCGGPTLLGMWAGTLLVSPLTALPAGLQRQVAVLPTASFPRACLVAGSNVASPFATDPFVALTTSITLPVSTASTFKIISD